MIPEFHALAFTCFMALAAWQQLQARGAPVVLVYTGVAVALSLRALVSPEAHAQGLLGLLAALLAIMILMAGRAATGSELRLLLLVGAFLGPRHTLTAVLVTLGVMLLSAAGGALLRRGRLGTTRTARLLAAPHTGLGWGGGQVMVAAGGETVEAAGTAARVVLVSPGVAIVAGAVAGWIL
jgi:prepilin peptidase CpaA